MNKFLRDKNFSGDDETNNTVEDHLLLTSGDIEAMATNHFCIGSIEQGIILVIEK